MRLAGWTFALALAAACATIPCASSPARADDVEDRRAAARAALVELASRDEAAVAKAAARLAELGWVGATEIALRGADLDDQAWSACAEAFVGARRTSCARVFVSAARRAPDLHAKRLLALAHALDPLAGVERTPEETAAEVHRLLEETRRVQCATGYDLRISLLGHAAVAPLLDGIRDGNPNDPGDSISCSAVALLAEEEDLPAIRELFLAGKVHLAIALARMQGLGVPGATDALLDALAAGWIDPIVTRALADAPDKVRVLETVDAWIARQPVVADRQRRNLAELLEQLQARESVRTLESWIPTSKEPGTFVAIADALVRLGDPEGVRLLVRIASERVTRFPCRPSTAEELGAASEPGRLCPDGFSEWQRSVAVQKLREIAGKQANDNWERRRAGVRPNREFGDSDLDRAAAAYRAWWEAAKDKLRYDEATGCWVAK